MFLPLYSANKTFHGRSSLSSVSSIYSQNELLQEGRVAADSWCSQSTERFPDAWFVGSEDVHEGALVCSCISVYIHAALFKRAQPQDQNKWKAQCPSSIPAAVRACYYFVKIPDNSFFFTVNGRRESPPEFYWICRDEATPQRPRFLGKRGKNPT